MANKFWSNCNLMILGCAWPGQLVRSAIGNRQLNPLYRRMLNDQLHGSFWTFLNFGQIIRVKTTGLRRRKWKCTFISFHQWTRRMQRHITSSTLATWHLLLGSWCQSLCSSYNGNNDTWVLLCFSSGYNGQIEQSTQWDTQSQFWNC